MMLSGPYNKRCTFDRHKPLRVVYLEVRLVGKNTSEHDHADRYRGTCTLANGVITAVVAFEVMQSSR